MNPKDAILDPNFAARSCGMPLLRLETFDMLRMTKQADYGIVLMTHLARDVERYYAASELASATHIPLPTVSKILKLLVREGMLFSHRGVKGGYTLARAPEKISVAEMISSLEGPIAFTECIEDAPGVCSQEEFCRLRANWQHINDAVRRALDEISLADLSLPLVPPLVQLRAHSSVSIASGAG